jgi:dihydrofolate synthase/folylpolyglutamate synthase
VPAERPRPTPERLDRPFADPLVARLFPHPAEPAVWDLERTRAALADLADPHLAYPTLHVGGTNGKGSVAATAASVLRAAGLRVGLYTSPHLCTFSERILVDDAPVPESTLLALGERVRPLVARHELTFFEAATVLAFQAFARQDVDVAVLEVGLGGRLDATNVALPSVTGVTNIALDHAEYLGNTLTAIAVEKAGIAKAGVPFLTTETDPGLLKAMARVCLARGTRLEALTPERIRTVEVASDHTAFELESSRWGRLGLVTPLIGAHQARNAALAVALLERLPEDLRPDPGAVRRGVSEVHWPGRDQIVRGERETWLFDVAHNPAGAGSLADLLDRVALPRPWVALVGVLADKDWKEMLVPLCRRADHAILSVPESAPPERRWDPVLVREALDPLIPGGCSLEAISSFGPALDAARSAAGRGTVVVTGSVHTVGDAMRRLGRCPFGP